VYDIYLTTDRVVAVLIRHPVDIKPSASWSRLFIGGWGSRGKEEQEFNEIAAERHHKSQNLSPDELLALNPLNFQISNNDITLIELKRDISHLYHIKFQCKVTGRKLLTDFTIHKDQNQETRQLLTKAFPVKFKPD
jgi:hypothetical protein